jgi:MFS family permease
MNDRRAAFTLAVLFAINLMNFFDRQILPAVQERIRREWSLSDRDLGLLGTAFIVLYAFIGLPLGRLADVWSRKWLLAGGLALWSAMTVFSGLAVNFSMLLVARLGVGVGEASCAPAATSLVGDLFPAQKRARAMALFMLGLPVGLALSLAVSAFLADRHGWQTAFLAAGIAGILLVTAVPFIQEPARGKGKEGTAPESFWQTARQVLSLPTMWWLIVSGALHNFNMYALGTFLASFFRRYHGLSLTDAGNLSGLAYGVGAAGILVAGPLCDRAYRWNVSGRLHLAWIASALIIPSFLAALAVEPGRAWLCAGLFLPACFLLYFYYGTVYATIQDIVVPQRRGLAMAIYFFGMYVLGGLYGPVAMGALSDYFARRAAEAAGSAVATEAATAVGLQQAMYIIPALSVPLTGVLLAASFTVKRDHQRAAAS